jgi:hypothetical protein
MVTSKCAIENTYDIPLFNLACEYATIVAPKACVIPVTKGLQFFSGWDNLSHTERQLKDLLMYADELGASYLILNVGVNI